MRTLLAAILTTTALLAAPAPANAAGCMARYEYRSIDTSKPDSWYRGLVEAVADTKGRKWSRYKNLTTRAYPACNGRRYYVTYRWRDGWAGPAKYAVNKFRSW